MKNNRVTVKLNKSAISWISYDFANSSYHLIVITILFPLAFKTMFSNNYTDLAWSIIASIPIIAAGIISPFIGAYIDTIKQKKSAFVIIVILCIIFSFLMSVLGKEHKYLITIFFMLAYFMFSLSQSVYNAFLPTQDIGNKYAWLSSLGWGIGYLGGILVLPIIYISVGGDLNNNSYASFQLAFIISIVFFIVFSLPSFCLMKDIKRRDIISKYRNPIKEVFSTIRKWRDNKELFKFLIFYYLINDGISTLVFFTSIYASTTLLLSSQQIMLSFLIVQIVAVPATIIFGYYSEKIGYKNVLYITILIWIISSIGFYIVSDQIGFYILAVIVGFVIGSTPSIARGVLSKMLGDNPETEIFGFHAFASRASSVLGPILFGIVSYVTGNQQYAMLSLIFFFVAGGIMLKYIKIKE